MIYRYVYKSKRDSLLFFLQISPFLGAQAGNCSFDRGLCWSPTPEMPEPWGLPAWNQQTLLPLQATLCSPFFAWPIPTCFRARLSLIPGRFPWHPDCLNILYSMAQGTHHSLYCNCLKICLFTGLRGGAIFLSLIRGWSWSPWNLSFLI